MATLNPYSDSLLMDALRGSLSNAESLGRGFAVAPVGLLGDVNALARQYITPRLPQSVQGLLQAAPAAPTTEQILSKIPRASASRMETSGMEQLGAAMNPRGPVELAKAVKNMPVGMSIKPVDDVVGLLTPSRPVFDVSKRDASDIFGAGAQRVIYKDPTSGGAMEVLAKPDGTASVLSLEVPEKFRGKGIGESLQSQVMQDFPSMMGQVSSKAAAKTAYRLGRRPPSMPDATLDEVYKLMDENSSVNLVSPEMQKTFMPAQPSFTYPQEEAMRLAQQRAALPKEQGGLGLLANNTADERAAAMGFDTPAYHGTASTDIQKFMPEGGRPEGEKTLDWYKNRQAKNEPVGYMSFRSGSFFSPKTDYAGHYAPEGTGVMYPVNLRMDNPLNLLPDSSGRYGVTNKPDVNKTIDAMVLQDSIDKSVNEIAIIDPDQIRSRFAAFDPFRKTAATAAAMGVAAPDLLAQEQPVITQQQIDDELAKYGLLGR